MNRIKAIKAKEHRCDSCYSTEDVACISLSDATDSFSVCKECRKILINKLKTV